MNVNRKIKLSIGIILLILFVSFPFLNKIKQYVSIPDKITTFESDQALSVPQLNADITIDNKHRKESKTTGEIYPIESGESQVVYKMANIPVKKIELEVLKDKKVVPGGQSVGVKLQTSGVMVVGHHLVNTKSEETSPGEKANIHVGDVIVEMNGSKIQQMEDVKPIVTNAGKSKEPVQIKLKRGGEFINTSLKPILNKHDQTYQIGLYIRDSATGIGTVTFYDEQSGKYGALGHVISDADTKKPLDILKGKIVNSTIMSIEKGNQGIPGEKQAKFSMKDDPVGTVTKNTPFGIFGKLNPTELKDDGRKPIPIGLEKDIEEGPAQILTVVEGDKAEKFDIEIVNSTPQKYPGTKGMVIKVTDKELLEKTGGIVQGMSGSPIIQNGKLIGAVTHVFVNDPTSGYGVHIKWMLEEADINLKEDDNQKQLAS